MERMIEYMPTAWRVYGRVRGIALSRDRFQFVFQREEDLVTVLNDRPWSYNRWTMVLERWTANPPEYFLQTMYVWIHIRHIPVNFFTVETMFKLASEVGKVKEVAYDPKVSHTKDYIRALVLFDTNNPAREARKLTVKGGTVTIASEYEKIHKRCFHCLRLTHEKIKCPYVQKGTNRTQRATEAPSMEQRVSSPTAALSGPPGPPGFPVMFPELSGEERKMAMLYISHADPTERLARIERVKQGIAENLAVSSVRITRITKELDKGKGHVFSYTELLQSQHEGTSLQIAAPQTDRGNESDADSESSGSKFSASSAPIAQSGFQLGPSSEGRVIGNARGSKAPRKRPQAWKRSGVGRDLKQSAPSTSPSASELMPSSKRKAIYPLMAAEPKNKRVSEPTVASSLKPLPFQ
ncbi:uncharacterized protein LOC108820054 [Raphanus sativus]|uniref:Uncharacterized protein LOC108820054 n=1 Tax=Raphanus sativus TaxID=3726 RepID=A0A6J0KKZ3_RAPSA|nr:uncharacterized protein LOC108820054 [Raphanus sativus]